MGKSTTLIAATFALGVLLISATSAYAIIESGSGANSGQFSSGNIQFTFNGVTGTCAALKGSWTIQKILPQEVTKRGGHEDLSNLKWTKCSLAGLIPVKIEGFEFQLKQPTAGQTEGFTFLVSKDGKFKTEPCSIEIGTAGNEELKTISGANEGTNVNFKVNLSGITYTATPAGGCEELGIKSGKEALLKSDTLKTEGQKLI